MSESQTIITKVDRVLTRNPLIDVALRLLNHDENPLYYVRGANDRKIKEFSELAVGWTDTDRIELAEDVMKIMQGSFNRRIIDRLAQLQADGAQVLGLSVSPNFLVSRAMIHIRENYGLNVAPVRASTYKKNLHPELPGFYAPLNEATAVKKLKTLVGFTNVNTAFISTMADAPWLEIAKPELVIAVNPDKRTAEAAALRDNWEVFRTHE